MSYVVAVDIGGTFTDLVAYDHDGHQVAYTKSPTTYDNFVSGILDCFGKAKVRPDQATFVNHGTTLVINAYIQRKGAKAALVTTEGFRDVLEIARANRPDPFDLYYRRDEPLIPRERRFEVKERIDYSGNVITPLDLAALDPLAARLKAEGVEAVAVFFMNSYANAAHEEAAAARLKELLPSVYITHSTELTCEWYEYERTSTVASNAYVGPQVSAYIRRLESDMEDRGFKGSLFMMGSNGGLLSVERTCRQPIGLVESGPIGGCIGAGAYAEALGFKNVVAFDMGGTTAKCALVENGRYSVESIYYANGYVKGFPIRSPVINIVEVGSGGGSIAWLDSQKRLHVGPKSAGSTPGPVCYGRGGTEPTVTDANLVLGRLSPDRFLGGELKLDTKAAERSIRDVVAAPLGYGGADGVERMADGILSIAIVIMGGAIRQVSVEHGLDPRDFILFSYGGGGPLHASALAHELNIPTIVIPPAPGNFSAVGMLLADARLDLSKTFTGKLAPDTIAAMGSLFAEMEKEASAALAEEFGASEVFFERFAEMRYVGQRHNIKVPVSGLKDQAAIRAAFERDYKRRYGHADARAEAELQALHLSAFARQRRPDLARLPQIAETGTPVHTRPVYFAGGRVEATVYDRATLRPGFTAEGPAVIEEYGSTTLVAPGDRFEIGRLHEIRIDCRGK
ncbi:MAG TPA: hydantoinase/oxoprolinase family protein [Alphaproteobacteria bacterium]|nr:hydantoinase/oxoprolinase family protein [Alphaproteobacteria bacterium]